MPVSRTLPGQPRGLGTPHNAPLTHLRYPTTRGVCPGPTPQPSVGWAPRVVLPKASGRDLVDRYAELCPDSVVVFMSGYTDDAIAHHGILEPGTLFIEKPFTTTTLLTQVRKFLGSAENAPGVIPPG